MPYFLWFVVLFINQMERYFMIGGKRDRDFEEDEDNTVEAGDKFQRPKIYPLSADTST